MKIVKSHGFKKDEKRWHKSGNLPKDFEDNFKEVLTCLFDEKNIPQKYQDHPMKGDYNNTRDCHICSDVVLFYSKNESEIRLKRLVNHSEFLNKDRKSTRLNSSHIPLSRMPSSA